MAGRPATTAIILCGGRGTRFGSVDKPLLDLGGKTLLGHVIDRLRGQVDALLLSCARTSAAYEAFGLPVVDDRDEAQGPLGGLVSALPRVATPWVLTTPADTPFLPADLVASLAPACRLRGAAVVRAGDRRQNLTMLLDGERSASLAAFYADGGRAIHRWLRAQDIQEVELPAEGFLNVNTPDDLADARRRLPG